MAFHDLMMRLNARVWAWIAARKWRRAAREAGEKEDGDG
jgi:hypothetical protein